MGVTIARFETLVGMDVVTSSPELHHHLTLAIASWGGPGVASQAALFVARAAAGVALNVSPEVGHGARGGVLVAAVHAGKESL